MKILIQLFSIVSILFYTQAYSAFNNPSDQKKKQTTQYQNFVFTGSTLGGYYLVSANFIQNNFILKIDPSPELLKNYNDIKPVDQYTLKTIPFAMSSIQLKKILSRSKNLRLKAIKKDTRTFTYLVIEKVIYINKDNPTTKKTTEKNRPEYLLFGNDEQLWITHLKANKNDFFHIMKIRTDMTAAYLLSESSLTAKIEGTDAEQFYSPFFIDTPALAKVKNTATLHLTFQAEKELLKNVKKLP